MALLERIDYNERQHAVYAAGRALSSEMEQVWVPRPVTADVDLLVLGAPA
jgi:hypothetical protein